jgi:allantoin racemase
MRIRIITPIVSRRQSTGIIQEYSERNKSLAGLCADTKVDRVNIEKGPLSIESRYDEALASPEILNLIKIAQGVDAFVINCFLDPAVKAGREITNIPILGPGHSSMLIASAICDRFSILTILPEVIPAIRENVRLFGFQEKIASIRHIGLPVLQLRKDENKTMQALLEQGKRAINDDRAEVLILGCTGMTGMAQMLSNKLEINIIDPLPTALKLAESISSLKLSHSKFTYPTPPKKKT